MYDCCVAMVVYVRCRVFRTQLLHVDELLRLLFLRFQRTRILTLEFADAMQFLQNYPSVDVVDLLQLAERIRDAYPQLPEPVSSEDGTPKSAPASPRNSTGDVTIR
jgi:hypothetical protein